MTKDATPSRVAFFPWKKSSANARETLVQVRFRGEEA
jgi:hypothetical protein